ncbi:MAG: thiamine diphosphokinase [Eubacteriales bacterium]|nr:thiamine diphosphokinase [Eubacteriales bacterium]
MENEANLQTEKKCILMCAGAFTPVEIERQEGDLVIAVDAGLAYLEQLGILPDLIVGDFDSLPQPQWETLDEYRQSRPQSVLELPVAKDDTDTLAAVKEGLARGYRKFYLYGALGGRIDHAMANIQTLVYLKEHGAVGYLMDASCMAMVLRSETVRFHRGMEGIFSLFALDREIRGVTLEGLRFEIRDAVVSNGFPVGTSNQFLPEEEACVTVGEGTALVIVTFRTEHEV